MKEVRIEKVMNGYIVRCFGGNNHDSYDDTFVYPDILQVVSFISLQMSEIKFSTDLEKLMIKEL